VGKLCQSDPIASPLTYPGRIPDTSGVLLDNRFILLRPVPHLPVGQWIVCRDGATVTLAGLLQSLGVSGLSARHPVVAVGSNASPGQVRRKLLRHSVRPVVPMTLAEVPGIIPGVSAHVSRPGYVPAVPVEAAEVSRLFVLWLDDDELAALDRTEPNYRRCRLPAERHPVVSASGAPLPPCFVYVGKHGHLVDAQGRTRRLTTQHDLIRSLLDESPRLRRLCGTTPESFIACVQHAAVREAIYRLFPAERLVQPQPGLIGLPGS
jgi:hypothetical protein